MSDSEMYFYVWAMALGTLIIIVCSVVFFIARDNEKTKDGSYDLSRSKAKAQADIVANNTKLLLIQKQKDPNFEDVLVERE